MNIEWHQQVETRVLPYVWPHVKSGRVCRTDRLHRRGLRRPVRQLRPERGAAGPLQVGPEGAPDREGEDGAHAEARPRLQGGTDHQDQHENHGESARRWATEVKGDGFLIVSYVGPSRSSGTVWHTYS